MDILYKIPDNWVWTTLEQIADMTSGGTPSRTKKEYWNGNINWLKSGELKDTYIHEVEEKITEDGLKGSSAKIFPKDTLLMAMYGATVGRLGILNVDSSTNQAVCAIFNHHKLFVNEYLFFYLLSMRQKMLKDSFGGAQPNLSQGYIKSIDIPFAPLNEQKRIVAKIEKLFSNLDNSDKYLLHLEKQLKRYRQSVLKSAFDGELTREWRNRNKYSLDDWQYQTISDLANKIFAGGDKPETVSDVQSKECPYPIYSNGLKDNGLYGYTNIYKVEDECITISARGTIGFPLVRNEKFVPIVRLIVVIPKNYISSKYLKYYLESKIVVQSGSSIPQLTVPMVKQIEILVPKLEEQQEIANQIEKHFSIIDKLEAVVQQSIKESKRLRQSILKQAFDGKLVEQDPNDENASVLLEKIAKAKEEYQKAMKRKK
ncbi:restriction endonuclease subunit S [Aliarcobacter butzleri]|uniref:restriction endonuclease subunit S n=1 Tax=Aliarcobacter butzleri TaxID=28197 RepID=UPI0021B6A9D4|nr:restriction endonuclease subunit S [Aliarcobacter butzleri]MCT7621934.1 restriction endonuclease subunit S [Aliarcobacter butzleri]